MPLIPAGYAEATFVFRRSGAVRDSTWSIGLDDADFATDSPVDMANDVMLSFTGSGRPYVAGNMLSSWTFLGVNVTKQLESGPLIGQASVTITGSIGAPAEALPPNCAILARKNTASGGRRNRGRAFLPPVFPSEGSVDASGTILSTSITAMQLTYSAAFTDLATKGYTPVLFHSAAPFTPTPITAFSIQSLIATQRRRMRK